MGAELRAWRRCPALLHTSARHAIHVCCLSRKFMIFYLLCARELGLGRSRISKHGFSEDWARCGEGAHVDRRCHQVRKPCRAEGTANACMRILPARKELQIVTWVRIMPERLPSAAGSVVARAAAAPSQSQIDAEARDKAEGAPVGAAPCCSP